MENNMIQQECNVCNKNVFLEDKYIIQECPNCGYRILPINSKNIEIEDIGDILHVNCMENGFDFLFDFTFKDSDDINAYLTNEGISHNRIYCEVNYINKEDKIIDLGNINTGICYYCDDSESYNFNEKQVAQILSKIIRYIDIYDLGEVRISDENKELLLKYLLYKAQSIY